MPDFSLSIISDGPAGLTIEAVAGNIRCEVVIPDPSVPVPVTVDDRAVMLAIRSAIARMRGPGRPAPGILYGRLGAYFLWAMARHVQASLEADGPTAKLGDLIVSTKALPPADPQLPRLQNIVIE